MRVNVVLLVVVLLSGCSTKPETSEPDPLQLRNEVPHSLRMKQAKENIRISGGLAAAEIAFKEAQLAWEQTIIKAH